MVKREIQIVGRTDEKGKFQIYGMDEINDFFCKHPNCRILGEFRVFDDKTSAVMIGLYYQYYVPEFQTGFYKLGVRLMREQVDEELRGMSIITKKETYVNGKWESEIRKVEELNTCELVEFLDELKWIAAEHFEIVIYDNRV